MIYWFWLPAVDFVVTYCLWLAVEILTTFSFQFQIELERNHIRQYNSERPIYEICISSRQRFLEMEIYILTNVS